MNHQNYIKFSYMRMHCKNCVVVLTILSGYVNYSCMSMQVGVRPQSGNLLLTTKSDMSYKL